MWVAGGISTDMRELEVHAFCINRIGNIVVIEYDAVVTTSSKSIVYMSLCFGVSFVVREVSGESDAPTICPLSTSLTFRDFRTTSLHISSNVHKIMYNKKRASQSDKHQGNGS